MGVSVREKNKGSGEWWIFIRHAGERAAQKYGDKETAEAVKTEILKDIRTGRFDIAAMKAARAPAAPKEQGPTSPTLREFFEQTITPLWETSLHEPTFARYETSWRIHILPELGDTRLKELSRDRLKSFVVSLRKKNAARRTKQADEAERKLSKDSVRLIIAALRAALTEAVEKNLLPANPATRLGKLYRESDKVREEVDPFSAEEIPLLLDATQEHFGFENYIVMLTAFHTGMRSGEIAGLEWPDIDFRNRFIVVRRQLKDGVHGKTKTKKLRKVDISDVLLHELQTLKKQRREEYLRRGKNEIPASVFLSPGLIVWEDGKPVGRAEGQSLDMDNWRNRVFWKACDKAKIRRRRLHDTRHTFASILLMNGESPAYVKEQLGHSSIKMTVDIYGHWIPGANRQAVNRLPSLASATVGAAVGAQK